MKRNPSIRFVAASMAAALAMLCVAAFAGGTGSTPQAKSGPPQATQNVLPQPDTSSSDWKPISDDLGIWIGKSDHVGVRGRLYVRQGVLWIPVAIDSAADIHGVFPAGR